VKYLLANWKGDGMKSTEIKKLIWGLLLPLLFFAVITYVGNVLIIGEKIGKITCSLVEILVDILLIFGPLAIVIWKVKKDVLKYKFVCFDKLKDDRVSAEQLDDLLRDTAKNYSKENMPASLNLALMTNVKKDKIIHLGKYIEDCEKKSSAVGRELALLAALSVVVSPKKMTDTLGMLFWNFRIISKVLEIYGVRPSLSALVKLYCNVLFSSLLVGSIEEVMENFDTPVTGRIPFLSPITQAVATIYACSKTVKLTQYYLNHGVNADKTIPLKEARTYAFNNLKEVWHDKTFQETMEMAFNCGMDFLKDKFYSFWKDLFSGKNKDFDKNERKILSAS